MLIYYPGLSATGVWQKTKPNMRQEISVALEADDTVEAGRILH